VPIIIEIHKAPKTSETLAGMVRLTEEAETALRQLSRETGLSMRCLASTIIIQAENQIEIKEIP